MKKLILVLSVLALFVLVVGCVPTEVDAPDGVEQPPEVGLAGQAVYYTLTKEMLDEGVELTPGWNTIVWSQELGVVNVQLQMNNTPYVPYVYGYSERGYWFNDKDSWGNSADAFTDFVPGNRYLIRATQNVVWRSSASGPQVVLATGSPCSAGDISVQIDGIRHNCENVPGGREWRRQFLQPCSSSSQCSVNKGVCDNDFKCKSDVGGQCGYNKNFCASSLECSSDGTVCVSPEQSVAPSCDMAVATNATGVFDCSTFGTWCRTDNTTYSGCMDVNTHLFQCQRAGTCNN